MKNSNDLLQPIVTALQKRDYTRAEALAINIAQKYPLFEDAWVLLGDSLMQQECGLMADKVYKRAALFNPHANWYQDKLDKLNNVPNGAIREEIERLLQIPKKTTVGAAIIAKNEERCIHRCLNSLVHAVDEILVIDTGSTDQTVEIAKSFPKTEVVHFSWCDDFSAARNFGMSQLQSRWIFWVDADEHLHPEDIEKINYTSTLLESYDPHPLLYVGQVNQIGESVSVHYTPRLFPLRGQLKYHGKIHEQLGAIHGNRYTDSKTHDFFVRIRLLHDGYDPNAIDLEKKLARNIELLRQMTEVEPHDPTWWLYLGRELQAAGIVDKGMQALIHAEKVADETPGFGALLEVQRLMVIGYIQTNDLTAAEKVCKRMIEANPEFPDSYYYLAVTQIEKGKYILEEVEENLNKSKHLFKKYRGLVEPNREILEWKADLRLANLYRSLGKLIKAKLHFQQVLNSCPISYKQPIEQLISSIS